MFNLFLNDIFSSVTKCEIFNYADDNTLSSSGCNIDEVLQLLLSDTQAVIKWFQNNFMKVNPEKFQLLLMKPHGQNDCNVPQEFVIEGNTIEISDHVKLLGVHIDDRLKFNDHVKILCTKANRQLKVMNRFKNQLGDKEKRAMFNSFVLSTFNFCPVVWMFCGITAIKKIERVQERALRFLTNDSGSTYAQLLCKTNSSTILLSRLRSVVIEVYKCLYKLNPYFLNELFHVKKSSYNLRDTCILQVPQFKKVTYGKHTIQYYGSHLWNCLPNDFKQCIDFNDFKKMIMNWKGPKCSCNLCGVLNLF